MPSTFAEDCLNDSRLAFTDSMFRQRLSSILKPSSFSPVSGLKRKQAIFFLKDTCRFQESQPFCNRHLNHEATLLLLWRFSVLVFLSSKACHLTKLQRKLIGTRFLPKPSYSLKNRRITKAPRPLCECHSLLWRFLLC